MKIKGKNRLAKSIFIIAAIASVCILAFSLSSCITIKINDIKGSGQVETKQYEVSGFETIEFSGIGNIFITQDDTNN